MHLDETMRGFVTRMADQISDFMAISGDEPLDGDETAKLGRLLALELDLKQGNITPDEYEEALEEVRGMRNLGKVVEKIAQEILEQYGDDLVRTARESEESEEDYASTPTGVIAGILTHELALRNFGLQGVSEIIRRRIGDFPAGLDIDETIRLGNMLSWYLEKRLND